MNVEDYDGADLIDPTNERIGTVERSYVDDSGAVRFVEVKMGALRARRRIVPMDQAERAGGALRVPFSKDVVDGSPDASSAGDTLEGETLDQVRAYYAQGSAPNFETIGITEPTRQKQPVPGDAIQVEGGLDAGEFGQVRDLGDVIEVPIVEEELVKRPVVKEVLRIRKSSLSEVQTVSGEVRREEVLVDEEGKTRSQSDLDQ